MKRSYVAPEVHIENFVLFNSVAAGGCTIMILTDSGSCQGMTDYAKNMLTATGFFADNSCEDAVSSLSDPNVWDTTKQFFYLGGEVPDDAKGFSS